MIARGERGCCYCYCLYSDKQFNNKRQDSTGALGIFEYNACLTEHLYKDDDIYFNTINLY